MPSTLTVYPDAHPETSTVDGRAVHYDAGGLSWAALIIGAGNYAYSDAATDYAIFVRTTSSESNPFDRLDRGIFLFNTAALPDACVIVSAVFSLWGSEVVDTLGANPNINVYTSNPANNDDLTGTDYALLGSTALCDTPIDEATFSVEAYNNFILNATGLAAISKTGITKLGTRNASYDVSGTPPAFVANKESYIKVHQADGETDKRPKLVITYYVSGFPTDAITRVTSITHRYDRGVYNMEIGLGDVVSDFGIPGVDTGAGKSYEPTTFQKRMEDTAKMLREEAGMSREEALRIARKLETLEDMERQRIEPERKVPTREEFWGAYPGVPYPYDRGRRETTPLGGRTMLPKPVVTPEEEAQIIKDIGIRLWNKLKGQQ